MSARVRASATASLPEMSISCSSWSAVAPPGLVATAMDILLVPSGLGARGFGHTGHDRGLVVHVSLRMDALGLGVLTGNPLSHRGAAQLDRALGELLLVLTPVPETVRAHGRDLVADLLGGPDPVRVLVLTPHLPLARVVVEGGLVHHRDAILHRADRLADPAAAAGIHVGVVQSV